MSRLYLRATSDARKTEITARGHEAIEATIYWGSASNSKEAARIKVIWPQGGEVDRPRVFIETGEGVEVI